MHSAIAAATARIIIAVYNGILGGVRAKSEAKAPSKSVTSHHAT